MRPTSLIVLLWLLPLAAQAATPTYAPDVVTVRLTPAASRAAWQARGVGASTARLGVPALDQIGVSLGIRWQPEFPGRRPLPADSPLPDLSAFYTAHLPPGLAPRSAVDRLAAAPEVASVNPVAILPVSSLPPSDSLFANSYWFQQPSRRDLHALEAWAVTTGDTSIVVGILDTGVLSYHPDLGGDSIAVLLGQRSQIWTNPEEAHGTPGVDDDHNGYIDDIHGWDFIDLASPNDAATGEDWSTPDNDPSDFAAHGTAIAGLVGALSDNVHGITGTAWNVRLLPLRIGWACGGSEGCGEVRMDFVAQAIEYAAAKHIPILNCSFESAYEPDLKAALDVAQAAGVTIVAAAGNDGAPVDASNNYLSFRPEVLSVTSVGSGDHLSFFSNFGPQIDLCAPGEQIYSTWMLRGTPCIPTYRGALNGTSVAAPFVSGAAALVEARQLQLGRSPMTIEGLALRLEETADDIGAFNGGMVGQYGAGRINLERAVKETWRSTATRIGAQIAGAVACIRVNGGGSRIALATFDQKLVVLDGASLDTLALVQLPRPVTSGVAAGPIGASGGVGLFVGCQGLVWGVRPDGTQLRNWPAFTQPDIQMAGGPTVGDVDGDGAYEVICGTDEGHVWAWHIADPDAPLPGFPASIGTGLVQVALAHRTDGPGLAIVCSAEDGTLVELGANGLPLTGWQKTINAEPTAPTVTSWGGVENVVIAAGSTLYAFLPDGSSRAGFPVVLGGSAMQGEEPALGDIDLDGSDDIAIALNAPTQLDVRDSGGQSKAALNWPRALGAPPIGSPVMGQLASDAPPELMQFLSSGLTAFTSSADSLRTFPKLGGGGYRPSLIDLDLDGTTEVLVGGIFGPSRLYIYDAGAATAMSPVAPWTTFRGNFARTGNRGYAPVATIDIVPPGAVSDLRAAARGPQWKLLWTAPSDNGPTGSAAAYQLRSSTQPITESNFALGTLIGTPAPSAAGATDSVTVPGITPGAPMYFALRALDADGNASPVSNVASIYIPAAAIQLAPKQNPSRPPATVGWQADPRAVGLRQALRIHDVGGRLVRTIELGTGAGGTAIWDGKDDDGRRVAGGLYLVRLVSGGYHAQARLVLLP